MLFGKLFKKQASPKKHSEKKAKVELAKPEVKGLSISSACIIAPHITEKANFVSGSGQYIFKVTPSANKTEIKKAIKELYHVDVVSVKIINVSGYKKAIVKTAKGQKIELATA